MTETWVDTDCEHVIVNTVVGFVKGQPYPWYGGRDQQRIILTIKANSVSGQG